MYYIAGMTKDGLEMGCDFGFSMKERILLDEVLLDLPAKLTKGLVIAKRFSYFGDRPQVPITQLVGQRAGALTNYFNLTAMRDVCQATVVPRTSLLFALKRAQIKLTNRPRWHCAQSYHQPALFSDVAVYNPYFLRSMLGTQKYGHWDHSQDQVQAMQVVHKFIDFLAARDNLHLIIICNDLFCPHWDASGEISFNSAGELTSFNYFGQGNGQCYKYYPELEVWLRR